MMGFRRQLRGTLLLSTKLRKKKKTKNTGRIRYAGVRVFALEVSNPALEIDELKPLTNDRGMDWTPVRNVPHSHNHN